MTRRAGWVGLALLVAGCATPTLFDTSDGRRVQFSCRQGFIQSRLYPNGVWWIVTINPHLDEPMGIPCPSGSP